MLEFVGRLLPRVALALFACVLAAAPALAAGEVRRGPQPAWVTDTPVPEPKAERVRQVADGIYFLLLDNQDRPGPPRDVRFARQVYKVTDRSGLEDAAKIDIVFDPATEDVVLHRVRLWRDGKVQDRLRGANIQVIRREKDLDKGVMDGRKTAHLELTDVQVGDVVEYAYSIEDADPLLAGTYQGESTTSWSTPVALTQFRLLWPHERPITVRTFAGAPQAKVVLVGGRDEYLWRSVDPPLIAKEDDAPPWLDQWGRVSVSSMTSWGQVVAWSLPFYSGRGELTPDWAAKVDAIGAKFPDAAGRITEALRLVQDDIRYVSFSIGAGSYRPRAPAEVIRSGYGDCKDKALLLTTVLARLGIAAVPALTDSNRGHALTDEAPNTSAFDHAIVRIDVGGKAYWVDPTGSQEGGRFPNLGGQTYGWALPIRPGQTALEAVPAPQAPAPMTDVVERYELGRGGVADLTLKVTSTYRGDGADMMRARLASQSLAEFEKKYLEYYAGMYPGVRRDRPVEVTDDRDANVLILREAYVVPAASLAKDGLIKAFQVRASGLTSYKVPDARERRMPLWADLPVNDRHVIVLVTPGHRPPAPDDLDLVGKTFHFTRASIRVGDTLTITQTLTGVRDLVPPDEVAAYREDARKLDNEASSTLDLTAKSGGVIGGRAKLIAWLVGIIGCLALGVGGVLSVRSALAADAAYAGEGTYYPVTLPKFLLMSLATAGMYAFFWRWKFWRWAKAHDGQDIQPFWRTLFAIFWLWPMFKQANSRLERRLPMWLGAAAAILYLFWSVGDSAVNRWKDAPAWLQAAVLLSFVCDLPSVIVVERLNGRDSPVTRANSRFTWHTAVAVLVGGAILILAIIGWTS